MGDVTTGIKSLGGAGAVTSVERSCGQYQVAMFRIAGSPYGESLILPTTVVDLSERNRS